MFYVMLTLTKNTGGVTQIILGLNCNSLKSLFNNKEL